MPGCFSILTLSRIQRIADLVAAAPDSPTGWSDLPSDAEETYFFTAEETEDFRREKRRRLMEQTREERLKARMEEDGEQGEEIWGGSDEEPEESQKEIMRRTAKSLLVSPNPAQLEMRILANHGADARFAFLRGRWSRAWKIVKARVRADKVEEEQQKAAPKAETPGMGLVADYGDSDDEDDETGIEPEQKEEQEQGMCPVKTQRRWKRRKSCVVLEQESGWQNRKLTASK
ncbi:hypothetical protein BT96DRAFT_931980 [Gymnopus androsaceus JB14]|uniref:Uncharacterized protein n=1 Tax=Gymnopus androsaceus JB14 TaxID=1447944 RepID=A0A6A4IF25_9AGAR|nr:hypothetical protein BT96DRAFT_931980 [Gymnopus androsaceus JB14]